MGLFDICVRQAIGAYRAEEVGEMVLVPAGAAFTFDLLVLSIQS